jgi:hypothetical protein
MRASHGRPSTNPLLDDRDVELILDEVLDLGRLLGLPYAATTSICSAPSLA